MNPPASPSPGRWPTLILAFATAVGVPGSLIAAFKTEVLQHPILTALCVLIWWLLVLIAGLVTDVWSKLRSRWVEKLADGVDHSIQALFSRYRRRYLDWIFYRHRDFDVKGLTTQSTYNLELEQVFVDLTIQPPPPGGTPSDPIRPFPKELTGRRSIWDYLTSESFTDHLALIGAPGSGKTTLLKKIALQTTGLHRPKIRQKLPILLFLREHAEAILANPSPSLADVASTDLARKQSPIIPPAAWFRSKLDTGRCLVLLDGLDEVASQEIRQKVVDWVETQFKAFPRNRFLISSRPHGYRTCPIAGVSVLEIQPFNRDQMRQFVQNWYRANEIHASGKLDPGVEMKAREGAEDLLQRLGNSQTLTDLAVNPLLLTMIATVHRFRSSLPGRRVELYAEICEVFLGKRQKARGIEDTFTPIQKQRVLQPLAYQLMSTKKREIPVGEAVKVIAESLRRVAGEKPGSPEVIFLKYIEEGSGLLLERESGIYSFAHLAFQEYLAAVHIRENGLGEELVDKVADSWWHEVIRLYGAQGDASGIIAACLSSGAPTVPELALAIDCLEEAREVDPQWRTKIDTFLKEGADSTDPKRFCLAAETMLARRLRNMVRVDERTFVDSDYISHAEYQLFIDEKRATKHQHHQPDHWQKFRFPKGHASIPAVGMRSSDAAAFCLWLSERYSEFAFRLPRPEEAKRSEVSVPQELPGTAKGFWTTSGFERIGYFQNPTPNYLPALIDRDFSEESFARAYTLDRARHRARAIDLDRARARASAPALDLACTLDLEVTLACALGTERGHDIALALNQARERERTESNFKSFDDTRWMWRVFCLELASRPDVGRRRDRERRRADRDKWLSIYGSLVVLEARIEGVLPAIEGIRIIKEPKEERTFS